jgi:hypothetical protein
MAKDIYIVRIEAGFDLRVVAENDNEAEQIARAILLKNAQSADIYDATVIDGPIANQRQRSRRRCPVTRGEAQALSGRELDVEIGIQLFGWHWEEGLDPYDPARKALLGPPAGEWQPAYWPDTERMGMEVGAPHGLPAYHTDMNQAMEAAEKVGLFSRHGGCFWCSADATIWSVNIPDEYLGEQVTGVTAAEAVCRAALLCAGEGRE